MALISLIRRYNLLCCPLFPSPLLLLSAKAKWGAALNTEGSEPDVMKNSDFAEKELVKEDGWMVM